MAAFRGPCRPGSCIYMCASGSGARGGPGPPLGGVLARALRGSGSHVEVPDPSRGRSGPSAANAKHPSLGDMGRRRIPSRAGDGSGAVGVVRWSPDSRSWQNSNGSCAEHVSYRVAGSHSVATTSEMAEQGPELADGTPVTATVGNGGLTPSVLSTVEECLALKASVRRAGERQGPLSLRG